MPIGGKSAGEGPKLDHYRSMPGSWCCGCSLWNMTAGQRKRSKCQHGNVLVKEQEHICVEPISLDTMTEENAMSKVGRGASDSASGDSTTQEQEPDTQACQHRQSSISPSRHSPPQSQSTSTSHPSLDNGDPTHHWQEYVQYVIDVCRNDPIKAADDPPTSNLIPLPPDLQGSTHYRPVVRHLTASTATANTTENQNGARIDPGTDRRPSAEAGPRGDPAGRVATGSGSVPETSAENTPGTGPTGDAPLPPPPLPSPCGDGVDSLKDASGPTDVAGAGRVLVLFDMNGTLLYRAKRPLSVPEGWKDPPKPAFVHGDPDPFQYFFRPGARELVGAVSHHPRACVAFYTSMRGVNALPAALFLMPEDCRPAQQDPEIYDRPFNAPDPEGVNHWDTKRDLPKIWSTVGRTGYGFAAHNTVMVDDTPRKMRDMNAGLVVVPEYDQRSVVAASCGEGEGQEGSDGLKGRNGEMEAAAREQTAVMPSVEEYILRLLDESGDDIRPFIKRNPFRFDASPSETRSSTPTPTTLNGIDAKNCPPANERILESKAAPDAPLPHSPAGVLGNQSGGEESSFSLLDAVRVVLTTGPVAGVFDSCASSGSLPARSPENGKKGEKYSDYAATEGHMNSLDGTAPETTSASDNAADIEAEPRRDDRDGGTAGIPEAVAGSKPAWGDATGTDCKWPLPVAFSKVREMLEEVCAAAERLNFGQVEKEILERYLETVNAGVEVAGQRMQLVTGAPENL